MKVEVKRTNKQGTLAQMVEQWTENPCVPGSIPGGTTKPTQTSGFFVFYIFPKHKFLKFISKFHKLVPTIFYFRNINYFF